MKTYIELADAPDILQKKVEQVKVRHSQSNPKLLSVSKFVSNPYKDKSIVTTTFTAHLQISNYFISLRYEICTKPEWSSSEVRESGMIASEIIEFVKRCDWLQYGVSEALKEGAPDGTD